MFRDVSKEVVREFTEKVGGGRIGAFPSGRDFPELADKRFVIHCFPGVTDEKDDHDVFPPPPPPPPPPPVQRMQSSGDNEICSGNGVGNGVGSGGVGCCPSSSSSSPSSSSSSSFFLPFSWAFSAFLMVLLLLWCSWLVHTSSSDRVIQEWSESPSAHEKLDLIWDRITSNREPESWGSLIEMLIRGFVLQTEETERLSKRGTIRPFTNARKFIHTQGAFARVKWKSVPNNFNYTGLFAEEEVEGLLSYSKGSRITSNNTSSWGMGLKLFRDGAPPSASVFCSPTTLVHHAVNYNWNLLDSPLCNHVDALIGIGLLTNARKRPKNGNDEKFWTNYGHAFGTSNYADLTKSGEPVSSPFFPFSICLRAPLALAKRFRDTQPWAHPVEAVGSYPVGELLYEVLAFDRPGMLLEGPLAHRHAEVIGEIWTQSEFVSSKWGDNHMYFQHQRFEEDLEIRPEWKNEMTVGTVLMDGWAYVPLYADRFIFAGADKAVQSLAPGVLGILQMLTNPKAAKNFIIDQSGIADLRDVVESVLLGMHGSPNPNEREGGGEEEEGLSVVRSIVARDCKSGNNNSSEGSGGSYRHGSISGSNSSVEISKSSQSIPQPLSQPLSSTSSFLRLFASVFPFFSSSPSTHSSSPPRSGSSRGCPFNFGRSSSSPLPPSDSRDVQVLIKDIPPSDLSAVYRLARSISENELDGHFYFPRSANAAQAIAQEPLVREVVGAAVRQYQQTFGMDFVEELMKTVVHGAGNVGQQLLRRVGVEREEGGGGGRKGQEEVARQLKEVMGELGQMRWGTT